MRPSSLPAMALFAAFASSTPLPAQRAAVHVTARAGLGVPSDGSQMDCGSVSAAYSVDVQGTGRVFPHLSVDHFAGSGGGDIACVIVESINGTARGGLRLDGATRAGVGAGARLGGPRLQLEGLISTGLITGQNGFMPPGTASERTTRPHIGGQVALVVFRHAVVSTAAHWIRLATELAPAGGPEVTTRYEWSPTVTVQAGVRIPVGRR